MTKHLAVLAAIAACLTLPAPLARAEADVCPGVSASINATATVLEPVGVTAVPLPPVRPMVSGATGCSLRMPPSRNVLIQLSAHQRAPMTLARSSDSVCVQQLDPRLLRQYQGGTITVIFPND